MVREKSKLGKAVLEPVDHRHDRIRVRCTDPQLLYADLSRLPFRRRSIAHCWHPNNVRVIPKSVSPASVSFCRIPATQEQLDIERFFKTPHSCGHSRLPNAQVLNAIRKSAFMGDSVEGSKPGMMH